MPELLKISELAARAGVVKSTIQHYLREGLLPPPVKRPHRNMHYYSSDLVELIRLIKDLQTRRNMPLSKIKTLLADKRGTSEIRTYLYAQPAGLEPMRGEPVSRKQLVTDSGLQPEHLDELEKFGFIRSEKRGRAMVYSANDAAIVHACASMDRSGLNGANGFQIEDMTFYLDAMRNLILREVTLFTRVMGKLPRDRIVELARSGLEGTSSLLLGLRRKVFLDLLGTNEDAKGTSSC